MADSLPTSGHLSISSSIDGGGSDDHMEVSTPTVVGPPIGKEGLGSFVFACTDFSFSLHAHSLKRIPSIEAAGHKLVKRHSA